MMKRRKKKRTFKPFGNPGRKLRTNVITSAPPMAIADRAPGILCSLSVCYSVCSCARLGDSGGRVYLKLFERGERSLRNTKNTLKTRRYFSRLVTGYVFREIFPPEKEWYWCRKQQANTTIKKRVVFLSLLVWGKETPPFRGSVCFVLREREEYTHI